MTQHMKAAEDVQRKQRTLLIIAIAVWLGISVVEIFLEPPDLVVIGMWELIIIYCMIVTSINYRHAVRYRRLLRLADDVEEDEIILARGYVRKERYRLIVTSFMLGAGVFALWLPVLVEPFLFGIPIFVATNSTSERMDRVALLGPKVREESA